ncbi:PAS domain-containing protein [Soehngenia saccharolytica]|nr:PAS domain-containing protein [Soehngenia saccharolytica]
MDFTYIVKVINNIFNLFIVSDGKRILYLSDELRKIANDDLKQFESLDFNVKNSYYAISNNLYNIKSYKIEAFNLIIFEPIGNYDDILTKAICLEEIVENLYDGVLLSDKDGKVVIYNKAMEDLERKSKDQMIGKYIWDAYGYSDKNKSEHMQVLKTRKPIVNRYKAHAVHNGKPVYKSYSTYPIILNGTTIGVYSISKDETKLQNLLSEIAELKRNFFKDDNLEKSIFNNGTRFTFSDIIGSSDIMKKLIKEAEALSWLDNSVLLVGETGTGKEVFAQSIHNFGKRQRFPFIGINCSAIPENLLETILFGSVKGAYTGAVDSSGLFEEADEGTLFLDELNTMPLNMQTKLLRALQEKSVRRVGGKETFPLKCRIISAMNEDPYELIEKGRLRQDLFYRISGYNLYIPPLNKREGDIFEISDYYIKKFNKAMNKNIIGIENSLKQVMKSYNWPGNIRELEHFIENIMVRSLDNEKYLRLDNIPDYLKEIIFNDNKESVISQSNDIDSSINEFERKMILEALEKNKWNVTKTAKYLKITRQSLIYRMRKHNIER